LSYGVLDAIVDDYMPLLDQMDDELELLEDQVLEKPSPVLLQRLLDIKHALIYLRRVISPQREVINRLSRDEFPMLDSHSRIYFRDVYDQMVRYQDLIESLRDIVGGAMDIYLNSTSLRLNEVMKALTIVSTIFLPLSFVAGIYGMNFEFMPELHSQFGYPLVWTVFILIVVGMLYFFKRRGWF
jgi:magnesium transporter